MYRVAIVFAAAIDLSSSGGGGGERLRQGVERAPRLATAKHTS